MIATGPRAQVLGVLGRGGYTFVTLPTWVVEYRDKPSCWWVVSAHSGESAAKAMQEELRATGPETSRIREIAA